MLWRVLQANQWRVARESGVEAVVAAMERFPMHPMVQLSALLCMIPLTLENAMMQVGCCSWTPAVELPVPCCCLQRQPPSSAWLAAALQGARILCRPLTHFCMGFPA